MILRIEPLSPISFNIWLQRFKESIVAPELEGEIIVAFLHYLADLKVFNITSDSGWELDGFPGKWNEDIIKKTSAKLKNLCGTEKGFAVGYFLRGNNKYEPRCGPENMNSNSMSKSLDKERIFDSQKSSNLSNLQIVKKVGRQLSPFLDMEKKYLKQLKGGHVNEKEAQLLYRYILTKMLPKPAPLPWQQLSCRRHK